jgi:hypothetical protein
MMTSYTLEIAGIRFSILHPGSIEIRENDPAYRSFFKRNKGTAEKADVHIELEYGRISVIEGMIKIFDSEQSWSMYKDINNYCLKLHASNPDRPVLEAVMNRNCTDIHVFCGEEFIFVNNGREMFINPIRYPLDQLLLMYVLSHSRGAIVHAAGHAMNDKGFIFIGRSGAVKSTVSKLFSKKNRLQPLSDDRIIIRSIGNAFMAFGTPWPGEAGIAENKSCSLHGMFFLDHGNKNSIKQITPKETMDKMIPVTSIPWYDEEPMTDILRFCEDLVMHIPAYEFHFTPDDKAMEYFQAFVSSK